MTPIVFLIDEDVPISVATYLVERSHKVSYVREIMPAAPDSKVVALADTMKAVLVSRNKKHFEALNARAADGQKQRFRHAGHLYFQGVAVRMRQRIEQCIEYVEFEWSRSQTASDKRMIVTIRDNSIVVSR